MSLREHKYMTSEDFRGFGTIYHINHTAIRFCLTICISIFNDVISLPILTDKNTFQTKANNQMRCFDIYFYSLSTARFYCLPTFFCPIIKESKLFQSCIRMKDPMGYIASLLCQKFKDHVWSFSIDVIYLLSLTVTVF